MFYISFFKEFKDWNKLTVNEKIVYSFLVNYATMHQHESWDKENEREYGEKKLNMDIIKEYIDKFSSLEFRKITNKKISEKTGISLRTVSTILNRFKKIDILNQDREGFYKIVVPKGFIDNGFLNLPKKAEVKGMQLVFWAFINNRLNHYNERTGEYHNMQIDTWASRLAMDMGVKKKDVQNYIHCLAKKGFLQRSEDNRFLVIKINGNIEWDYTEEEYDLPF
jgi:predicted transcriptional regulator